jgi:hypothetical protein
MNNTRRLLRTFLLCCSLFSGLSSNPFFQCLAADDLLRIGVWNIEKLSASSERGFPELRGQDSLPPRNDDELKGMAAYIRDELRVDALMVTEIDADSPLSTEERPQSEHLNQVAVEMGANWKYFLSRTGDDMRLGLLFNTERVHLKKLVNLPAPEFPVTGKDVLARDPFIVWIAAGTSEAPRNDLILICLHLKSQQGPFRDNRMAAVAKIIGDFTNRRIREALTLPTASEEPEAIILGDCNDSSFKNSGFKYMFDYLNGVGFQHVRDPSGEYPPTRINGSQIDHIFATDRVRSHSMLSGSFQVHTVADEARQEYRRSRSDHFPVTIDIQIRDDDDFTIPEALATSNPELRKKRMEELQEEAFARAAGVFGDEIGADDEDGGELLIRADVRDRDFQEILAPSGELPSASVAAGSRELSESGGVAKIGSNDVERQDTEAPQTDRESENRELMEDSILSSDGNVRYLQQNWTDAERNEFYSLRQGSPLMRRDFFNVLEQPASTELFRSTTFLTRFGFLPRRPTEGNVEGYPVGFSGKDAIELNCAACHTSKLSFRGKEYWVDGSQAMIDLESYLRELAAAIRITLADAPEQIRDDMQFELLDASQRLSLDQGTRFGRFVRRLTGTTTPSAAQARIIFKLLWRDLVRRQRYNDYNDFGQAFDVSDQESRRAAVGHVPYGYSRLDALSAILNQACAEHLNEPRNARRADAPVNFPAIWDAPQHVHVQWNGAVDNTARFGPIGRNAGQVIGVFGLVNIDDTLAGYDSSISFDAIERAEELVTKLWSPQWHEDFGRIDASLAAAGEVVYREHCIQCHSIIDRDDPRRRANDVLVPIHEVFGRYGKLNTDPVVARNWKDRNAIVGTLANRLTSLPFRGRFPELSSAEVPARDILSHLVFNAIARSFLPWRDELTIEDSQAERSMTFSSSTAAENLLRYKSRPLNGIWSTAPYLHNGSVLNLRELLTPPGSRRTRFNVGTTEFDPESLGYVNGGPFEFDTTLPGNCNQGHEYGTTLSDEKKKQLIEFIKTL